MRKRIVWHRFAQKIAERLPPVTRLPLEQILLGHDRPNMRIVSIKSFAQFLPTAPITTRQVAQNQFEHFTQQAQWLWNMYVSLSCMRPDGQWELAMYTYQI